MSFEAIAYARRKGSQRDFEQKWLTVPTDDRGDAHKAFAALGFEVRGMTIHTQAEATAIAER